MTLCYCGCNQQAQSGNKFIHGHNLKLDGFKPEFKGRYLTSEGYWRVYKPEHREADKGGYVLEHRLEYEESRDCCLLPWVIIHHKDDNTQNNIWYNLRPYTIPQHMTIHQIGNTNGQYRRGIKHTLESKLKMRLAHLGKSYIDMSNRVCSICGTSKTYLRRDRNNIAEWYRQNDEFVCRNCYLTIKRKKS